MVDMADPSTAGKWTTKKLLSYLPPIKSKNLKSQAQRLQAMPFWSHNALRTTLILIK